MLDSSIALQKHQQQQRHRPLIQDTRRYALLLRQCGDRRDLAGIKDLHARIASGGRNRSCYLENVLVQMYSKCGEVEQAWGVFDKMEKRNVFSWTAMIAAFAGNGHFARALDVFRLMDVPAEEATFVAVLGACTRCGCCDRGREVHGLIRECGMDSSLVLCNTLVNMYGRCHAVRDAREVFDRMPHRSVVSWNAIIGAYAHNLRHREALDLFWEMTRSRGIAPDEVTFLPVLQSCSALQDLAQGEAIHALASKQGLVESSTVTANALINMYGKCGNIARARDLFDRMKNRSIVSLNTIVSAYALNCCGFHAIELYKQVAGIFHPNDITFVVLLDACGSVSSLEDGMELHREIRSRGLETRNNVRNALINMYGKCGSVESANFVFRDMASSRDVVSWTAMITALAQNGRDEDAVQLFREMELEGVKANEVTLAAVATAFVNLGHFGDGCGIYPRVASLGMKLDVVLGTVLIGLHGICGKDVDTARLIFEKVGQGKNVICWNAMIGVYAHSGKNSEALNLLRTMDVRPNEATIASMLLDCSSLSVEEVDLIQNEAAIHGLDSTLVAGTALVSGYGRAGCIDKARAAMERIRHEERDLVSWNSMITACSLNNAGDEALEIYHRMNVDGLARANEITYSSLIVSCPRLRALRCIHHTVASSGCLDLGVANSLITAYGRLGEVGRARELFDAMATSMARSSVSWTAVIASYAQNGLVHDSLELFAAMALEGIHPSEVTFTSILYACSHAGTIDQACQCFASIGPDYELKPNEENFRCVVDLLGRAGKLEEARDLVESMPFAADGVAWTTLLAACKTHDRGNEARNVAREMMVMQPENGASYVMLSSIIPVRGSRVC